MLETTFLVKNFLVELLARNDVAKAAVDVS